LNITEAESIAASECVQEAILTLSLIKKLTGELRPALVYVDNLGAIFLLKNQQVSARTKHIDVRHHFTRNLIKTGRLERGFKRSENNSANIMTKNLPGDLHQKHEDVIREGTMTCWREDVKSDPSVRHFGGQFTIADDKPVPPKPYWQGWNSADF
jgi:hypothetical protein